MNKQRQGGCLALVLVALMSCFGITVAILMGILGLLRSLFGFGGGWGTPPPKQEDLLTKVLEALVEEDGPLTLEDLLKSCGGRRAAGVLPAVLNQAEQDGLLMLLNDTWIITDAGREFLGE